MQKEIQTGEQAATEIGRIAGRQAEKGLHKVGNAAKKFFSNALKKVAKKIAIVVVKALTAVSLKFFLIVIIILAVIGILAFFIIECEKAYAFKGWGSLVQEYCNTSQTYKSRGYTSVAGLSEQEFNGLINAIFTGELPIDETLPPEEKEKLKKENRERQENLKEASTDEERYRIKAYLTAERDSILRSPEDKGLSRKFLDLFNKWFKKDDQNNNQQSNNQNNNETIKIPRLEFINDKDDFTTKGIENAASAFEIKVNEKLAQAVKKLEGQRDKIYSYISSHPDNMKNINDLKIELYGTSTESDEEIKVEVVKYPMEDKLYKMLEPYALSWKVLYLIDKSIDEDEFDDFKDIEQWENSQSGSINESLQQSMKEKFIRQAIPKFMPQFKVVRHLRWETVRETSTSCGKVCDEGGCSCKCETETSVKTTVTPVYIVEYVNKWNQEINSPTEEREIIEETWSYGKECGDGPVYVTNYTYKKIREPVPALVYNKEGKEVTEYENVYGERRKVYRRSERIVRATDQMPGVIPKNDYVKKIFVDIYGEEGLKKITFDIEHGLYLSQWAEELAYARYEVATAFGLEIEPLAGAIFGEILPGLSIKEVPPEIDAAIMLISAKYSVDPNLIRAIIMAESGFNPYARSSAGACGLMQLMPETAAGYGIVGDEIFDISKNIDAGTQYIRGQISKFGDVRMALAAYNWGPGNVGKYPSYDAMYPYMPQETKNYVPKVISYYMLYRARYGGEMLAGLTESKLLWPVPGHTTITSYFGWRKDPQSGDQRFHHGIDIADWKILGAPVVASADGIVSIYDHGNESYGKHVIINHGNNISTLYGHLREFAVSNGATVKAGDVIGYVGSTGKSTGPHLHYEVRIGGTAVNPLDYVQRLY